MASEPIVLRATHLEQVRQLLFLKSHHEAILKSCDDRLAMLLNIGYDVDINGDVWHLDLESGVLSHDDTDRDP